MFKQGKEYKSEWNLRYRCVWADETGGLLEAADTHNRFWVNHNHSCVYTEAPLRISMWFNVFAQPSTTDLPWISNTRHGSQQAALNYAKNFCGHLELLDTVELVWEQKR